MPNKKVYLEKIKNSLPVNEMEANLLRNEQVKPLRVNFDNDHSALLDISNPRAAIWAKMIDLLHKKNRPVFVEVDADTDTITALCIPVAAKVLEIYTEEDTVYVIFSTTDARHSLRRDLPGFQKAYDALLQAKETGASIMVTATLHEAEIIDVRPLPPSFGVEVREEPAPLPPVPAVPVSLEKAVELFNMVNAQTCSFRVSKLECIPFKYPYGACWIRAHLMCYLIDAEGTTPEKMWIYGKLNAKSSNVPQCSVGWGWHVAPTLLVTQPDGPPVRMVLDPSLCGELATEAHWKSLMGASKVQPSVAEWKGYNFPGVGERSQTDAYGDMEEYRLALYELWAKHGLPPYKCPLVK